MSRMIEKTAYVDYYNVEGMGACKIRFMLDTKDVHYICHGAHMSKTRRSEERTFPAHAEVSAESREEIVDTLMRYTGMDTRADWAELRVQVDNWIDELIEKGWVLPCME